MGVPSSIIAGYGAKPIFSGMGNYLLIALYLELESMLRMSDPVAIQTESNFFRDGEAIADSFELTHCRCHRAGFPADGKRQSYSQRWKHRPSGDRGAYQIDITLAFSFLKSFFIWRQAHAGSGVHSTPPPQHQTLLPYERPD